MRIRMRETAKAMKTLTEYLDEYGISHRNPLNQKIHFFCVPLIFFATLGIAWCLPLGAWMGLEAPLAYWVNGATVGATPAALFYLMLSLRAALVMAAWLAVSVLGIVAIDASPLSLLWTSVVVWVASWAVQFYGHEVEGAKPSFAKDLLFLLIGPLFVVDELSGGYFADPAAR